MSGSVHMSREEASAESPSIDDATKSNNAARVALVEKALEDAARFNPEHEAALPAWRDLKRKAGDRW